MKRRNPTFGYQRIAQQLSLVFDIELGKDVVRRVLADHYRPDPGDRSPSWLSFLGHTKDSLWSLDFFQCESLVLKSHWVMVVMDHYTRQIVGIAVHAGPLDDPTICRMFGRIVSQGNAIPRSLSSDHDPLFAFHRWKANLRILEIQEIKPYPTCRHPTRSWNASSGRFVGSFSTTCLSGRTRISNEGSNRSETITTQHVRTVRLTAERRSLGTTDHPTAG